MKSVSAVAVLVVRPAAGVVACVVGADAEEYLIFDAADALI